jgi:hypothetical protein
LKQPYHNVLITNSSIAHAPEISPTQYGSAFLYPSFRYVPNIPLIQQSLQDFVKAFVLPKKLHAMHEGLTIAQKAQLTRDASLQTKFEGVRDVQETTILICGHGGRDERCGVMGPLLRDEFTRQLDREHEGQRFKVITDPPRTEDSHSAREVRVGLLSHIGGHKWAGNVGIYVPRNARVDAGPSPLAGMGICYGRVRPEDVEGIIVATLVSGVVIKSLFRGGVDGVGNPIRL